MTDYTELIKALRAGYCYYTLLEEAADAIEELSMKLLGDEAAIAGMKREIEQMVRADKPRWIPVTERLPEKDKWVLRYSAITEATWLAYLNSAGEWMDEQGASRYVTHWMPLPEPPKEEV